MYPALQKYLEGKLHLLPEHQALVDSCFKPKSTKRNELLVPKGEIARNLYFVIKGYLRVFLISEDGSESTRFLILEGNIGTAFPSYILQQPSVAAIQSPEPSEVLALSYHDRERLLKEVPGWETMHRISIEQAYIDSIQRIESLITMDAKDRYNMLLKSQPELIKKLPSKIIADYLGISQETLSRLKSKK